MLIEKILGNDFWKFEEASIGDIRLFRSSVKDYITNLNNHNLLDDLHSSETKAKHQKLPHTEYANSDKYN